MDTAGETALLFLAGPDGLAFSHAIRKGPMLTGPDLGPDGLYKAEEISRPHRPPPSSWRWPSGPCADDARRHRGGCSTPGST